MLDAKVDDGQPLTGKVRGAQNDKGGGTHWGGVANSCGVSATNSYNTTAPYDTSLICMM